MNRELAIQLAKLPNVSISFFVPKCSDGDKRAASDRNVKILEAKERPGFESPSHRKIMILTSSLDMVLYLVNKRR